MSETQLAKYEPQEKAATIVSWAVQKEMADNIAASGLFGLKNRQQVLALMAVAAAEGRHPASVAMEYHIIQGRPALKADALLARFQKAGGKVRWTKYTDAVVEGVFSHPAGGEITINWDTARAKTAGLTGKDNWRNYPRQMLRSRCASEGVKAICPGVCVGEYTVEEVEAFDLPPAQRQEVRAEAVIVNEPEPPAEPDDSTPITNETRSAVCGLVDAINVIGNFDEAAVIAERRSLLHACGVPSCDTFDMELNSLEMASEARAGLALDVFGKLLKLRQEGRKASAAACRDIIKVDGYTAEMCPTLLLSDLSHRLDHIMAAKPKEAANAAS